MLLLLAAGITLAFNRSPRQQLRVIKGISRTWKEIDRSELYRWAREFRDEKLVDFREQPDGTIKMILTERGKKKTLQFDIDKISIKKPIRWDGHWHVLLFDIPEKRRRVRDALRNKLKELGFYEWQKSVFIHPFPCRDEVEFLIEFFDIRPYVRYAELINPLNEAELKLHFKLT